MRKLSTGLTTAVRFNHGLVAKVMPEMVTLPPPYGHRQLKKELMP